MNEVDYKLLVKQYEDDVPISYVCQVHQNKSESVTIEYFYDLVHTNCRGTENATTDTSSSTAAVSTVPLDIANHISQQLLQTAATTWHILPAGDSCFTPTLVHDVWLVGISTVTAYTVPVTNDDMNNGTTTSKNTSMMMMIPTKTRIVSDFGCQVLTPNNSNSTLTLQEECCHVIRSELIFRPLGTYNQSKLLSFVHDFIDTSASSSLNNENNGDSSFLYRTASILDPRFQEDGTVNEEARNNLKEPNRTSVPPPLSPDAVTQESSSESSKDITVTGGFLIASFISVMIGVFVVLLRRHRHSDRRQRRSRDSYDNAVDDTFRDKGEHDDEDDDFHVTVVNDPNYNSFPVKRQLTCRSCVTEAEDAVESELLDYNDDDHDDDDHRQHHPHYPVSPKYAFDLGHSLKRNVMGTYAPTTTTIPVVAPYPFPPLHPTNDVLDVSACDSEAEDSWAQTDGTVGSLEERLEEITAEI